jgi:hypothetical protein
VSLHRAERPTPLEEDLPSNSGSHAPPLQLHGNVSMLPTLVERALATLQGALEAERRARIAAEMLAAEREARIETQYNLERAQRDWEAERKGHIETRDTLVRACVSTQTGLLREREERERVERRLYERELHIERLEQNAVGRVGTAARGQSPTRRTVAARERQSHPPDVLVGREARMLGSFNGPGKDATARGLDSEVPVPDAPHRGGGGRVQKADSSALRRGRSQGTAGAR